MSLDRCSTNRGFASQPRKSHSQETSTFYRRLQANLSRVCNTGTYYLYYTGYQIFPLLQKMTVSFWAIHSTNICKIMNIFKAVSGSTSRRSKTERRIKDCLPKELPKQVKRLHYEGFCFWWFSEMAQQLRTPSALTEDQVRSPTPTQYLKILVILVQGNLMWESSLYAVNIIG